MDASTYAVSLPRASDPARTKQFAGDLLDRANGVTLTLDETKTL